LYDLIINHHISFQWVKYVFGSLTLFKIGINHFLKLWDNLILQL